MHSFFATIRRDFLAACRHKIELLTPILFFLLTTMLFPLAVTANSTNLAMMGPGVIWISLLFANLLAIESLFVSDYEDGTLEQIVLASTSLSLLLMGKLVIHWLLISLPLLLVSGLVSKFYFLSNQAIMVLFLSLILGSPILTIIGAIGSSLTLGVRHRGMLLILLIVPLYLPVLIFGTSAVNDASNHLPFTSQLLFLAALFSFAVTFAPFILGQTIRMSLE